MNTKDIGDQSESKVLSMFLDRGYSVLIPFGDNKRYDLVVEDRGKFIRIQIKTGSYRNGCVISKLYSTYKLKGKIVRRLYTREEIDYVIIYSPDLNKFYLINVREINVGEITLRVKTSKNSKGVQKKKINFAEDFEFKNFGELH